MIILIDNYDSFTFNVYHYLSEIGTTVKVYRNDEISIQEINKINPSAIVLSPGPCTPNETGICLNLVRKFYYKIPILGICLGHQTIAQALGGKIIQCEEIMHGKICEIKHNNHILFKNVKNTFKATRYHSLIIERHSLPNNFEIIAETNNNIIMSIAHKNQSIFGVQFHPESIGTSDGKQILKNFLEIINYES